MGRELGVQAKPGIWPLVIVGTAGMIIGPLLFRPVGLVFRVIFVRYIGKGILRVAEHPCGIIKIGIGGSRVSRDADPPVLIQQNRRSNARGVENHRWSRESVRRNRASMFVCAQQFVNGRRGRRSRMRLLGKQIRPRAEDRGSHSTRHQCDSKDRSAQVSSRKPRAHNSNSDGWKFQEGGPLGSVLIWAIISLTRWGFAHRKKQSGLNSNDRQ